MEVIAREIRCPPREWRKRKSHVGRLTSWRWRWTSAGTALNDTRTVGRIKGGVVAKPITLEPSR